MKTKELKTLANKIAKLERTLQVETDERKIRQAEEQIMELSSHVDSLEDMFALDDMISKLLEE